MACAVIAQRYASKRALTAGGKPAAAKA